MAVFVERHAVVKDVLDFALPAVAALISGDAVEDGFVGDQLQIEIEGGVNAEPCFVNLFGAEALFEFAAECERAARAKRQLRGTAAADKNFGMPVSGSTIDAAEA